MSVISCFLKPLKCRLYIFAYAQAFVMYDADGILRITIAFLGEALPDGQRCSVIFVPIGISRHLPLVGRSRARHHQ
ncbi:MAG: hypothetical protein CL396_08175 [Acidiferrobacteraceae bacterium]|nr:hypothetical protein [Acidiferrobacteraceae bacterium]